MANQTVALLLRVTVEGKQPYLRPILKNGKVRDKWASYQGTETHFSNGTYALRYKEGSRLVFKTVGKALDAALMAQRRKEIELQAINTGLQLQTHSPAPAEPKKAKREIMEATSQFLDDVAMRDRRETEQGYRFTLDLLRKANPDIDTPAEPEESRNTRREVDSVRPPHRQTRPLTRPPVVKNEPPAQIEEAFYLTPQRCLSAWKSRHPGRPCNEADFDYLLDYYDEVDILFAIGHFTEFGDWSEEIRTSSDFSDKFAEIMDEIRPPEAPSFDVEEL